MAQSIVLKGSELKIYIGGKLYPEAQSINYTIDYGEEPIYGIDSHFPQEIATTKVTVRGSISGVVVKLSGGLQGKDARTKINEILFGPYVSIRIKDRYSDTDIIFIPQAKITAETFQAASKGVARLSFNFSGIIPYNPLDLN